MVVVARCQELKSPNQRFFVNHFLPSGLLNLSNLATMNTCSINILEKSTDELKTLVNL